MIAALVIILCLVAFAQSNECGNEKICKKCIQNPKCAWYFDPKSPISSNTTGCYNKKRLNDEFPSADEFAFSTKPRFEVRDEGFADYGIMPKSLNLELPIGDPFTFDITVIVPKDATKIHIKHDRPNSTMFKLAFYSDCNEKVPENLNDKKHKCNGVKPGSSIAFRAKLIAGRCPNNGNYQQKIEIGLAEKASNKLKLDVYLLCSCACEHPPYPVIRKKAKQCNKHGGYKCGVCKCEKGYSGAGCEIES